MLIIALILIFIAVLNTALFFFSEKKISLDLPEQTITPQEKLKSPSVLFNTLRPLVLILEKLGFPVESMRQKLVKAGLRIEPVEFTGFKLLTAGLGFVIGLIVFKEKPAFFIGLVVIGFFFPNFWLNKKIKRRQFEIARDLPSVIDMLNLCVGAGLDFMLAVNRVIQEFKKCPVIDELKEIIHATQLGKQRRDALQEMAERIDMPEVSSFVRTLLQTEKMGSPVADVLKMQAEDLRMRRFYRGEEQALKAPVKLLLPLVVFILPVVLIIVGGPILLQFVRGGLKF